MRMRWLAAVVLLSESCAVFAQINHVVIAWFNEPLSQIQIQSMQRDLTRFYDIPGVLRVDGGPAILSDRPIVDDSFSFAVVVVLDSAAALSDYLTHPIHTNYLVQHVEGKVKTVTIYDF